MKQIYPNLGLSKICWLFGISRQAYYQYMNQIVDTSIEKELVIKEVINIRNSHPRIGTRKLYVILERFLLEHQIKIGRDVLFNLLSINNLLIRKRRRSVRTTFSHHWLKKYSNLIRNFTPLRPNELYVSDITYWKMGNKFLYIHLITDAYSHKIVGYKLSETLEAEASVEALLMALLVFKDRKESLKLIYHSDRGVQYCSTKYVKLLQDYNVNISMTETGDPLENAIAERINGIIKEEYLNCYQVNNFIEANELLDKVVKLYNEERPHMSIGNLAPEEVHKGTTFEKRLWKKRNYEKEVHELG